MTSHKQRKQTRLTTKWILLKLNVCPIKLIKLCCWYRFDVASMDDRGGRPLTGGDQCLNCLFIQKVGKKLLIFYYYIDWLEIDEMFRVCLFG